MVLRTSALGTGPGVVESRWAGPVDQRRGCERQGLHSGGSIFCTLVANGVLAQAQQG